MVEDAGPVAAGVVISRDAFKWSARPNAPPRIENTDNYNLIACDVRRTKRAFVGS
jgi:hypothetical protein